MTGRLIIVALMLLSFYGTSIAQERPGLLKKLELPGDYSASVGDVLVASFNSYESRTQNNVTNVKVEIKGRGLASKPYIVLVPPDHPATDRPAQLQVYVLTSEEGEAAVHMTIINGKGEESRKLIYNIAVSRQK